MGDKTVKKSEAKLTMGGVSCSLAFEVSHEVYACLGEGLEVDCADEALEDFLLTVSGRMHQLLYAEVQGFRSSLLSASVELLSDRVRLTQRSEHSSKSGADNA